MTTTSVIFETVSPAAAMHIQMATVKQDRLKNLADENKKNLELLTKRVAELSAANTSLQCRVQVLEAERDAFQVSHATAIQLKDAQIRELAAKVAASEKRNADDRAKNRRLEGELNTLASTFTAIHPVWNLDTRNMTPDTMEVHTTATNEHNAVCDRMQTEFNAFKNSLRSLSN